MSVLAGLLVFAIFGYVIVLRWNASDKPKTWRSRCVTAVGLTSLVLAAVLAAWKISDGGGSGGGTIDPGTRKTLSTIGLALLFLCDALLVGFVLTVCHVLYASGKAWTKQDRDKATIC